MDLQRNTDLNDPSQRFKWVFEDITVNGMPTVIPGPVREEWSEHMSKAGFVHINQVARALSGEDNAELVLSRLPGQRIQYQPPVRGQQHSMNTSGKWVGMDQEIHEPLVPDSARMTSAEKAKMIEEFREEGLID